MSRNDLPLIVGLTGGIASGKTRVSDQFATLGADVVDTDVLARDVVATGTDGLAAVVARFGDDILDDSGALNRSALREQVFSDANARKDLEAITHPRIGAAVIEALSRPPARYFILVVPLLARSRLRDTVSRVLSVDCDEPTQLRRLLARDSSSANIASGIIAAQVSREARLRMADDIISNTGTLDQLSDQVLRLHQFYKTLAAQTPK
ncbi:MAG: dephospho-CoA kinase [Pseudomonadota bacterium]